MGVQGNSPAGQALSLPGGPKVSTDTPTLTVPAVAPPTPAVAPPTPAIAPPAPAVAPPIPAVAPPTPAVAPPTPKAPHLHKGLLALDA